MLQHIRSRSADKNLIEEGFTLVELLVVIVILGILAAVVVFAVGGTEADAKVKACLTERSTVEAALVAYNSAAQDNGGTEASSISNLTTGFDGEAFLKREPIYWQISGGEPARKSANGLAAGDTRCQP